jgi:hypothetical protein
MIELTKVIPRALVADLSSVHSNSNTHSLWLAVAMTEFAATEKMSALNEEKEEKKEAEAEAEGEGAVGDGDDDDDNEENELVADSSGAKKKKKKKKPKKKKGANANGEASRPAFQISEREFFFPSFL